MTPDTFTKLVNDALSRLYDSPYLHAHPLATLLLTPQERALRPSQELRRVLLQAIRALRPQPGTPAQSADWRAYRILELRYLEGLSPAEAMERLALSRSQFYRDQARLVETMAQMLWAQRPAPPAEAAGISAPDTAPAAVTPPVPTRGELASTEARRLSHEASWEQIDIVQMVEGLRSLLEPLARAKRSSLRIELAQSVQPVRVDRIMLRQALLSVLTYAVDLVPGGEVTVRTVEAPGQFGLEVVALLPAGEAMARADERRQGVGLRVSQELMTVMGGTLEVDGDLSTCWQARLTWPTVVSPTLLVVDDNKEFANMCRRYLVAYDWQVIGVEEAAVAREFLAQSRPSVILLDIMLPKEDGWELLAWLKAEPALRDIPVLTCSVLNEPDLARMLGAAAHLTKPLSQAQLLQALGCGPPVRTSPVSAP